MKGNLLLFATSIVKLIADKSDYIRLLSEASINDETKFQPVSLERPRTKGRPPKHYHPLLEKEKHLDSVVRRILPKHIADIVCLKAGGVRTTIAKHHGRYSKSDHLCQDGVE